MRTRATLLARRNRAGLTKVDEERSMSAVPTLHSGLRIVAGWVCLIGRKTDRKNGDDGVCTRARGCLRTDLITSYNEGVERALWIRQGVWAYASGTTIDASSGEMYITKGLAGGLRGAWVVLPPIS